MKTSEFNIYLKYSEDKYMFVQGITGAFDLVNKEIHKVLEDSVNNNNELDKLDPDIKDRLFKRGYITNKSFEEEQMMLAKITSAMNKRNQDQLNITFIPTYNCNFRCVYCFEKKLNDMGKEWMNEKLSNEIIDTTFNKIDKWIKEGKKISYVTLFGGEPLLPTNYEIVKYIIESAKKRNINVMAVSNGYSLEKYVDLLGSNGIDYIQITLDGLKEFHDKRRYLVGKQPTFDKICNNIDLALKTGVKINLRSNLNKENFEVIDELIKLYDEKGWTSNPSFAYYFKATHKCYEKEANVVKDIEIMKELGSKFDDVSKFDFNSIYNTVSQSIKRMFESSGYAPIKSGYCGANAGMYTIDPFGDVYACWDVLGNKNDVIGKVDILNNDINLNERNTVWKGRTVDKIDKCSKCKYSLFCGGGCAAHANVVFGDMYSPYCEDFKTIFSEVVPIVYKEVLKNNAN